MNSTSPAPRVRPKRMDSNPENRGTVLRASILESALELGVASNRTVANWIFNPVEERDEEENERIVSPSLTYASTATSEESNLSAGHPYPPPQLQRTQPGAGVLVGATPKGSLNLDTSFQYPQHNGLSPARSTPDSTQRPIHFDLRSSPSSGAVSPAPSSMQSKNKLRKPRPDGYESEGGYRSESGKSKEKAKKDKKSKKKGKDKDRDGEGAGATDYESDGGYLSEASSKRKKSKKDKKDKKEKDKSAPEPTTDYETDKGYSSSFSKARSRKQSSVTSPVSGDESDGGYLSESSKKRRFFRLNSKSRKKKQDSLDSAQDQPPPVPALPPATLPIHGMFSRAVTPLPDDTPGDIRPSVDTLTSAEALSSTDYSLTADSTSTTAESDGIQDPIYETGGLTRAFADAESVRSPSIDFLSTFRRPATDSRPLSPSRFNPFNRPNSPPFVKPSASPSVSPTKSRPKISAPNTTTLASKHIPVPLTLTPPTPTSQHHPPNRFPPSPDPDYVLVTPNPSTPVASEENNPTNANGIATQPPPSPTLQRPKVISYYDLPPPSPPPRGPLPDVPQDISRSTSPSWSMMDSSGLRNSQPRSILIATPVGRPDSGVHPLSREITQDVPTIAQPVPPPQRGRVSPFPTAPVFPREQTTPLVRRTSRIAREAVNRALNQNGSMSATPYSDGHSQWPTHERVLRRPTSTQAISAMQSAWNPLRVKEQLGVRWAPRSASAMETRRPYDGDASGSDDGRSWMMYDDEDDGSGENGGGDVSDRSLSVPNTRPASTEPPEPSPDVNTILAGFRAKRDAELAAKSDMLSARDTVSGIVSGYGRDYLDVDEGGGDRTSWSDANSQHSFLDGEKSATIRAKFVKRVEAMYGKDVVPPVPRLDEGLSSRSG